MNNRCLDNYNYFVDYIENFDGLRNIYEEAELKIASEAIDRLLFDVERVNDERIT